MPGRAHGARFVLRGSLRREGQHRRLNVRLIGTRGDRALWAERCDRRAHEVRSAVDACASIAQVSMERTEALVEPAMQRDPRVSQIYFVRAQIEEDSGGQGRL